jgi:hypothetical protein
MANPKSRIEEELDGVVYTDKSRIEEYIAYIKGDSQTKPDKPRSRIEEQLDGITPGGGGGSTLIERTITENDVYFATDDDADGYSKVTVNVPQPVVTANIAAADLTNYTSGQTDLGGGFTITNASGIVGVGSETIDGVTYSGLEIGGAATFMTNRLLSSQYSTAEFQVIPTAWASADMRIVSTGGDYYSATVWTSPSNPYLMCVLSDAQEILDPNLVSAGGGNYYDPNLPHSSLIGKLLTVKYTYVDGMVVLSINGVDKAKWTLGTFNNIVASYGLNVGANGAAGADMLAVKAKYSGEALSWDGHTYTRID